MTEREAKGLAAELDSHRWWRVVKLDMNGWPSPVPGDCWRIVLRHRTSPFLFLDIMALPRNPIALAERLMRDGEDAAGGVEVVS